jgi:hypothetical protein
VILLIGDKDRRKVKFQNFTPDDRTKEHFLYEIGLRHIRYCLDLKIDDIKSIIGSKSNHFHLRLPKIEKGEQRLSENYMEKLHNYFGVDKELLKKYVTNAEKVEIENQLIKNGFKVKYRLLK